MTVAERAVAAFDAALEDHQYVGLLDVFAGMQWLARSNIHAWHTGRIQYADELLQGGPAKLRETVEAFHRRAQELGLRGVDLPPHDSSAKDPPKSQVASQIPEWDKLYHVHYVSPDLPEKKLEKLREKIGAPRPPLVISILRKSQCGQCAGDLGNGDLIAMQGDQALCLECADLDHLVFLESGDACVTRRATKYSTLWAVVVRFSRSRKRYERQGVLVLPEALDKAQEECLADADLRVARQLRDAQRRVGQDAELVARMAEKIRALYPGIPPQEAQQIAAHTAARGSGRVGRSAAGRALDEDALRLAVTAHARHVHTRYDELLMGGLERDAARGKIWGDIEDVLERWRQGT